MRDVAPRLITLRMRPDGTNPAGVRAFLGRKKLGTIRVSEYELHWTPSGRRSPTYALTWGALRDFVENDANQEVAEPRDICAAFEIASVDDLADVVWNKLDYDGQFDLDVEDDSYVVMELMFGSFRSSLSFPFTVGEFWQWINEMDELATTVLNYMARSSEIEQIERLDVDIRGVVDEEPESWVNVSELAGYFVTASGESYPYRRAMSGTKTVGDWIRERFEKHYPGLQVEVNTDLPLTATLSEVRNEREAWQKDFQKRLAASTLSEKGITDATP